MFGKKNRLQPARKNDAEKGGAHGGWKPRISDLKRGEQAAFKPPRKDATRGRNENCKRGLNQVTLLIHSAVMGPFEEEAMRSKNAWKKLAPVQRECRGDVGYHRAAGEGGGPPPIT